MDLDTINSAIDDWPASIITELPDGRLTVLPGATATWEYPGYISIMGPLLGDGVEVAATPDWDDRADTLAFEVRHTDGTVLDSWTVAAFWDFENIRDEDEDRALYVDVVKDNWPRVLQAIKQYQA